MMSELQGKRRIGELLVLTGWFNPNGNRGGRGDVVSRFLEPRQPGAEGTG